MARLIFFDGVLKQMYRTIFQKVISGESLAERPRELGSEGEDAMEIARRNLHVTNAMEAQKFPKSAEEWLETCIRPDLLLLGSLSKFR